METKLTREVQRVKAYWETVRPAFLARIADLGDFGTPAQEFAKALDSGSIFRRYTPETLVSVLTCKIKNCLGRQELRRAWDNRILSPMPDSRPPETATYSMWREYTLQKYSFLCSHYDVDGGLVRLIDSVPCIPVENYDGYPEIGVVSIESGICHCPDFMKLSTWENLETFMDYGD